MKRPSTLAALAGLLLLSTGCASVDGNDDVTPGTVGVTAFGEDGLPAEGVDIVFHEADGSVLSRGETGSEGTLTGGLVPVGGMVTAVYVDSFGDTMISTITSVESGDDLVFGFADPYQVAESPEVASPSINIPSYPGATDYALAFGCTDEFTDQAGALEAYVFSACVGAGNTYDMIATAIGDGFLSTAFSVNANIPVTASTVTLAPWSTAWLEVDASVTNAPGNAKAAFFVELWEEGGEFSGGGLRLNPTELTGGAGLLTVKIPPAFGTASELAVMVGDFSSADPATMFIFSRQTGVPTMVSYDLEAELLPKISDATLSGSVISWTAAGDLSSADGGFVEASWEAGDKFVDWTITIPPGQVQLRLPELPADLEPTGVADDFSVGFYDLPNITGYDGYRNAGFSLPPEGDYEFRGTVSKF